MTCGGHPQAADFVGINVYKMRYAGVLISGALGGLGGLVYITAGVSEWKFENGVAGYAPIEYPAVANQEREKLGLENPVVHDTDMAIRVAVEAIRKMIKEDQAK